MKDNNKKPVPEIPEDMKNRRKEIIEKGLNNSEDRFKILFDYAPDGYYISDLKGNFIDGNRAAEKITGFTRYELIGKNYFKTGLLVLKDVPKAINALKQNRKELPTEPQEFTLKRKDGKLIDVEISTYPIRINNKIYVLGIARDISKRKELEQKVRKTEKYYYSIFENTGTAFIIVREDKTISQVNRKFEKLSGYRKKEIEEKMKWPDFVDQDDLEKMEKYHHLRRQKHQKPPSKYAFRFKDRSGNLKDILVKVNLIPETSKSVASLMEITHLKQTERALQKSEAMLKQAEQMTKVGGWEYDVKEKTVTWTDEVYRIYGVDKKEYDPSDIKKDISFYGPDDQKKIEQALQNTIEKGKPYDLEAEFYSARKEHRWVRTIGKPVFKSGEVIKIRGNIMDITQQKKVEIKARENENFITSLMDNLPIGIAVNKILPEVEFIYMNDKFPQIYRTTRKKLSNPGAFWDAVYEDPVFRSTIKKRVLGDIARGNPKHMSWENIPITRKGEETSYISAYNIPGPGQNTMISIVLDITDIVSSHEKIKKTMNAIIETISKIIDTRDPYTAGHQHRVYQLASRIANEMNLTKEKTEAVKIAALIHDIGKIGIPSEILTKPNQLSDIEFSLMKSHSQIGYDILKDIDFPYPIAQIILQHHERNDGSGYPNQLKGNQILLEAKIIGVADVVEAMSSHRPYRAALGIDVALAEITKNKGILYDPEIVEVCVKLFKEKDFRFE